SLTTEGPTSQIFIDADAQVATDSIKVENLHVALGSSRIDASGLARDAKGNGTLDFNSNLNLNELVRLSNSSHHVSAPVSIGGTSRFDGKLRALDSLRVRGFGGELTANAALEDVERYHASGKLQSLNLQGLEQRLGIKPLPYDGTLSGSFDTQGNLKSPQ